MREHESEGEPAHHARRPMNAFLIFCKRHRSVVRDKYPNLENRSITKILGEWWVNLDKDEKACYTGLAKQYKEAFLSANPDFKWYKLPAPPLRSSSRPSECRDKSPCDDHEHTDEKTNNNSTKLDFNKKIHDEMCAQTLTMFTPGKLADEAQIGGISTLLAKTDTKSNTYYTNPFQFNAISHGEWLKTKAHKGDRCITELQHALTETSRVFEHYDTSKLQLHLRQSEQFTNQDVINKIVDTRYSSDDYNCQKHWSDDEKNPRPGRSCKGKRYQEFMAVGGLLASKRQRRELSDKSPEEADGECQWEEEDATDNHHLDGADLNLSTGDQHLDNTKLLESNEDSNDKHCVEIKTEPIEGESNVHKAFNANDFDLDEKIKALPTLSYEKFQQRKKDSKRKKSNHKPKTEKETPRAKHSGDRYAGDFYKESLGGSQNRKPKKVSITRYELSSLFSSASLKREEACGGVREVEARGPVAHGFADLMALATLAEVAANTSKLEERPRDHTAKV